MFEVFVKGCFMMGVKFVFVCGDDVVLIIVVNFEYIVEEEVVDELVEIVEGDVMKV